MEHGQKGNTALRIAVGLSVVLLAALAIGSFGDTGFLNIIQTDDGCWRPAPPIDNNTFSSEEELRDYASQKGVEIPGNITFKTINGTLYQECTRIGGSSG